MALERSGHRWIESLLQNEEKDELIASAATGKISWVLVLLCQLGWICRSGLDPWSASGIHVLYVPNKSLLRHGCSVWPIMRSTFNRDCAS